MSVCHKCNRAALILDFAQMSEPMIFMQMIEMVKIGYCLNGWCQLTDIMMEVECQKAKLIEHLIKNV